MPPARSRTVLQLVRVVSLRTVAELSPDCRVAAPRSCEPPVTVAPPWRLPVLATSCEFVEGDAYELAEHTRGPADFVLMANAFHGVPDQPRLADAIGKVLKPAGRLAVVNWHQRRREETTILGEPRGPKSELRMSPEQTIASIEAEASYLQDWSSCRPITTRS